MTRTKAKDLGLEPLAEIVAMCSIAIQPNRLPEAPATAIKKVLGLADLTLDDIKIIEINEAFAAVPLVSTLLLAGNDKVKAEAIRAKTNVNGSAIATGHPNTASGARLIMNLMYRIEASWRWLCVGRDLWRVGSGGRVCAEGFVDVGDGQFTATFAIGTSFEA